MSHFYLPAEAWTETEALVLTGDEARHCSQVRRHRPGETISILDGRGRRALATITAIDRSEVRASVNEVIHTARPVVCISLLQAVPKGDGMEWIIEKAVELGVAEILPLMTERTIIRLDSRDAEKKGQKWQRQIIEACKQSGQTWMPQLKPLQRPAVAIEATKEVGLRLIASLEPGSKTFHEVCTPTSAVAIAIGPEGDFSPDEYHAFRSAGWAPVTLGPLTLRCETAAIASVAILGNQLASLR